MVIEAGQRVHPDETIPDQRQGLVDFEHLARQRFVGSDQRRQFKTEERDGFARRAQSQPSQYRHHNHENI